MADRAVASRLLVACALAAACASADRPPPQGNPRRDAAVDPSPPDVTEWRTPDALPIRPPPENCGGTAMSLTRRRANVLLVLDRSGSMAESTSDGSVSKWVSLYNALSAVLPRIDSDVTLGLLFFPASLPPTDGGAYSPVEICQIPGRLAIEPMLHQAAPVLDRYRATSPGGPTPTAAALRVAGDWFRSTPDLQGERYVILATDGGPNCNAAADPVTCICTGVRTTQCNPATNAYAAINCLDEAPAVQEVRNLATATVRTYVIGLNGTQDFSEVLNHMADAGGRARAGSPRYYPANSATELATELARITSGIVDCSLQLAAAPPDPNLVDVRLDGHSLVRDPARADGWDWSDDTHRVIAFYGNTCETIRLASGGSQLRAVFGCAAPAPP